MSKPLPAHLDREGQRERERLIREAWQVLGKPWCEQYRPEAASPASREAQLKEERDAAYNAWTVNRD